MRDATISAVHTLLGGQHPEVTNSSRKGMLFGSKASKHKNDRLLGTLDVLAVQTKAEYGADWKPLGYLQSKLPFYVLHAAACAIGENSHEMTRELMESYLTTDGKFDEQNTSTCIARQ